MATLEWVADKVDHMEHTNSFPVSSKQNYFMFELEVK